MKRLTLMLLIALSAPGGAYAADLLQVFQEARDRDAAYAAARATYQAGQERLPQARAGLLPSVNAAANDTYSDVDSKVQGIETSRSGSGYGYSVSVSQPLFRQQNFIQYQQAKIALDQVEAQLALAQQDLIVRVAQAYFDVLQAEENVALAQAQERAISGQLEQAKRSFEVGTATITDTHEAQARHDLTVAQEIAARNDLEVRKHTLQQIIGRYPDALSRLGPKDLLAPLAPADMEKLVTTAQEQNPQVRVQRAAVDIAEREVERNRAGHLPTLDVVASYSDNPKIVASSGANSQKATQIGLQLNLPIYQGGLINSRTREAAANYQRSRDDLETARRQVALQARQAYLGVTSGVSQVKALQQALASSELQLESTRLGQEVGVRTAIDVLNAQQQVYNARRDLAQARHNLVLSQLRLKAASGSLNDDDVRQVNSLLAGK